MQKTSFLKLAGSVGVLLTLTEGVAANQVKSSTDAELDEQINSILESASMAGTGVEAEVKSFINT